MNDQQTLTQWLAFLGVLLGGGGAIAVLTKTLIEKFGKGTTDRQTEVSLGVSILEKQIERAERDRAEWKEVEIFLRNLVKETDKEKIELQDALEKARNKIRQLEEERRLLLARQRNLAAKFARGETITLEDITGQPGLDQELEELEDTYMS